MIVRHRSSGRVMRAVRMAGAFTFGDHQGEAGAVIVFAEARLGMSASVFDFHYEELTPGSRAYTMARVQLRRLERVA